MKLLLDCADMAEIKEAYGIFPLDGVTTNPSILARTGRPPYEVLGEIRDFIGSEAELHVQVVSEDAAGMIEEADRIGDELGSSTYVKIPVTSEGLRAMKKLHKDGVRITGTAVYTAMQAFLAAKAGASYVAPYVNRIDNLGSDGIVTARNIQTILTQNDCHAEILAASFKDAQQVLALCTCGIGAATLAPSVLQSLVQLDAVTMAVKTFRTDFETLCGQGRDMSNI